MPTSSCELPAVSEPELSTTTVNGICPTGQDETPAVSSVVTETSEEEIPSGPFVYSKEEIYALRDCVKYFEHFLPVGFEPLYPIPANKYKYYPSERKKKNGTIEIVEPAMKCILFSAHDVFPSLSPDRLLFDILSIPEVRLAIYKSGSDQLRSDTAQLVARTLERMIEATRSQKTPEYAKHPTWGVRTDSRRVIRK